MDGVDGTPTVANAHHYADNDPLNRVTVVASIGLAPFTAGTSLEGVPVGLAVASAAYRTDPVINALLG